MKKLIIIAVLALFIQGCGVVKGVGKAVGFACQGVGAIGAGINEDLTAGSDGYSDEYHGNRHRK